MEFAAQADHEARIGWCVQVDLDLRSVVSGDNVRVAVTLKLAGGAIPQQQTAPAASEKMMRDAAFDEIEE